MWEVRSPRAAKTKGAGEAYAARYALEERRFVVEAPHQEPQLFDQFYAKRRQDIQKDARKLLRAMKEESTPPAIDFSRHDLMPERNNWLKVLECEAQTEKHIPEIQQYSRKIIPTFYTWDEYKIYLHVWRSDITYDTIRETVIRRAPATDSQIEVMAVIESTGILEPFSKDHLRLMDRNNFNFYLLCVPEVFVVRIKRKNYADILVSASPLDTVEELKRSIHYQKGYPKSRMDLVFNGFAMSNERRLYYYDVRDGSCVELHLQCGFPVRIKAACFWNHVYDLQVDSTATANEVLYQVLRQCASPYCGQFYIRENFIQPDFLSVESSRQYVFGHDECVLKVIAHEDSRTVVINAKRDKRLVGLRVHGCPEGTETVQVDMEGHYGVAYLRLHGLLGVTIDNMLLRVEGKSLNPYDSVAADTDGVDVMVEITDKHEVTQRKVLVFVVLETGAVQPLYINTRNTISEIKEFLISIGYPHYSKYNIWKEEQIIPDRVSCQELRIKPKEYIHVVAMEFPIRLMSLNGERESVFIHGKSRMKSIVQKCEKTFPAPYSESVYIFCGKQVPNKKNAQECGLRPQNWLFQTLKDKQIILEVLYYEEKVVLELVPNIFRFDIRHRFREWRLPESTMDSLEQLIVWRITNPNRAEKRPDAKPIKVEEEMLDNPKLRPGIDYNKLRKQQQPVQRLAPARLGACVPPNAYGTVELPPMQLYKMPRLVERNKDEGVHSLLQRRF